MALVAPGGATSSQRTVEPMGVLPNFEAKLVDEEGQRLALVRYVDGLRLQMRDHDQNLSLESTVLHQ
jgi:hypothetical protein